MPRCTIVPALASAGTIRVEVTSGEWIVQTIGQMSQQHSWDFLTERVGVPDSWGGLCGERWPSGTLTPLFGPVAASKRQRAQLDAKYFG
jgi:hypothetical protein